MFRALLLVALVTLSGCTYLVVDDALHEDAPCEALGDCAAGFVCLDGSCAAADAAAGPAAEGALIDVGGGVITAVDGVVLAFPADAVDGPVRVLVSRASATHIPVGFAERSGFYEVAPALAVDGASIAIPVDAGACDAAAGCAIFAAPAGGGDDGVTPWTALAAGPVTDGAVSGSLTQLDGVYVVGVAP